MNHIYRLVFNRCLGVMQVASELTSAGAQGGGSPTRKARRAAKVALLAALAVTGLPALAQTATWNAAVGNWGTGTNWSPQALPGGASNVVIGTSGAVVTQNLAGGVSINSLSVSAGQLLLSGGSLTATNGVSITGSGTVRVDGGQTLTAAGNSRITVDGANALLDVAGYANNLTLNAGTVNLSTPSGQVDVVGGTTVLNGGTLNVLGAGASLVSDLSGAAASRIELGASGYFGVRQSGNHTYAGRIGGGGIVQLVQSSGTTTTFSGDSSGHTGIFAVQEGAVAFNATGRTGASTIYVGLGAGPAQLTTTASGTFTNAGTTLIGNAPSTLTLGGSETVGNIGAFAGTINLADTHSLTVGGGASVFGGTLAGAGGLTVANSANLTLTQANSYTGATRVNGGTLIAAHNSALGSSASGTTVASGATLGVQGGGVLISDALTLSGTGVANGGALRNFSGANNMVLGAITLQGDTSILADAGSLDVRGAVTGSGTQLTVGGAADVYVYGAVATGSGGVTKTGGGTAALLGANTYTGATTVQAGALAISNGSALSDTAALIVNSGALAQIGNSETVGNIERAGNIGLYFDSTLTAGNGTPQSTFSGSIVEQGVAGSFVKQGSGTLALTGISTYAGSTTVNAGTLAVTGGGRLASTLISIASGATFSTDGGALNGNGAINNAAAFTLTGGGSETVDSVNGAGTVQLSQGSVLTLDAGASALSGVVSGEGGLTVAGTSITTLSGSNTHTGATTVSGGVLNLQGGQAIADTGGAVVSGGRLEVNASETIGSLGGSGGTVDLNSNTLTTGGANVSTSYAGVIVGAAGSNLIKTGTGTQTLSGQVNTQGALAVNAGTLALTNNTNAINGGITVDAGRLLLGADGAAGGAAGLITTTGSVISYANSVNTNTPINLNSNDTELEVLGADAATQSGAIGETGGPRGFGKIGSGTLTLAGSNTYTGQTAVSAGRLDVTGGSALADSARTTIAAGATLGILNDEAVGSVAGAGAVVLTGNLSTGGDGSDSAFAGDFSGGGALVKTGTGIFTLSGNSNHTGGTTVGAGTLAVGLAGAGSLGGNVDVQTGATLGGSGLVGGNVSVASGATLAPGNSIGTLRIAGDLSLNAGSRLDFEFGKSSGNFTSRGESDSVSVDGNLALGGATLDITDSGSMGAGLYRLFDYGGSRTGTVALGSTPAGATALSVQYLDGAGQVNLVDARGSILNMWNANGLATATQMGGGSGVWSAKSAVWTGVDALATAAMQPQPGFAIFGGQAGTVTLDASEGAVSATGLQFVSDGYVLTGDTLNLAGAAPVIRVGSGSAADASLTATIAATIAGTDGLVKRDGGTLVLTGSNAYTGGTTVASGTLRAGALDTFSAASAMTVASGATLDLGGFSQRVAGMTNAGTVRLLSGTPGTVLTVTGPWVGQGGTLAVGTTLGDSRSATDRVLLSGASAVASGQTNVAVTNLNGLGGLTTGPGIEIVGTENGASIQGPAFVMANSVQAGAYEYQLNTTDSGAYLVSHLTTPPAPPPTPEQPAPSPPPFVSVPLYRAEVPLFAALPEQLREANLGMLGSLHQRQGDVGTAGASAGAQTREAWGRVITLERDIAQGGTVGPRSEGRLTGFQAGTDLWADANWRAGVYAGQLEGDMKVHGFARGIAGYAAGRNDLKNQYLGGYATWRDDAGLYVDGVLQAGRHRTDVRPDGGPGSQTKGSSLLASLEVGKSFAVAPGWSVEPQLQLVHQRIRLDDSAVTGLTTVQQDAASGWAVRAGVRVKGDIATGAGLLQPYARLNLWHSASGTDRARFVGPAAFTDVLTPTGGSRTELAVGANWQITPGVAVYGELSQLWAAGGKARTDGGPSASMGVKLRW